MTVAFVEPAGQTYPAAHCPEHADVVAPSDDPYVPAGHLIGAVNPGADPEPDREPEPEPDLKFGQYVPAGHIIGMAVPPGQ